MRSGVAVDQILARAHLCRGLFDHPETLIPQRVASGFLDEAARCADVELLGAHVGRATPVEQLGVFGRRVVHAATLQDALVTAARIASIYSGELFRLAHGQDEVRIWHRFPVAIEGRYRQLEQYSLMWMLRFLRSVAGPTWRPRAVFLPREMPRAIIEMDLLRDSTVMFDQRGWAITLSAALLRRPLPATTALPVAPSEWAAWTASAPARDLPGVIRQLIETLLRTRDADIRVLARWLGTSVRTLQRRLAIVGTSYADVLTRTRFETAMLRLADHTALLCDIGAEIGYADPAHFTRAFRGWTGSAPRAFRRLRAMAADGLRDLDAKYARDGRRLGGRFRGGHVTRM